MCLAARSGAEVTCCFDGAAVLGRVPASSVRGVRVLFSKPGEIADELIRRLVRAEPTGRAVVVHEACVFGGFGAEVAARITERAFYSLEAPVLRVGGFDIPYPAAKLEEFFLPDVDRILDAVDRSLGF